jgi:hypothetical protein
MSEATPLVRPSHGALGDRVLRGCLSLAVRASLLVSPRPAALLVRKVFASGGAKTAEALEKHAPGDVVALVDEPYGDEPDMLLDVFRPAVATGSLPTPGYADAVGVAPTITPAQLRGLVLACGPYDLGLAREVSNPGGRRFVQVILWAYSGKRRFLDDPSFATWSVTDNITSAFPSTLVTVGNADPLRQHSEILATKLRAHGVEVETLFFPEHHGPPLGHEYQFDLDADAGQLFLDRMLRFLERRLRPTERRSTPAVTA